MLGVSKLKNTKVALDLDDVIVPSAAAIIDTYNQQFGTALTLAQLYSTGLDEWGVPDEETAVQRVDAIVGADEFYRLAPTQQAIAGVRTLHKQAQQLYIITGRPDIVSVATCRWLEEHFPDIFTDVIFSNLYDKEKFLDKGDLCVDLGVGVLIDDHLRHVTSASGKGIECVLFGNYPWNQADTLPAGVTRCLDWPAVLEYFDEP
jgi:5'(3')-deoxyribonucleotidase